MSPFSHNLYYLKGLIQLNKKDIEWLQIVGLFKNVEINLKLFKFYQFNNFLFIQMQDQLRQYGKIDEVPTPYQERTCTDVCCLLLGTVFALGILITSVFSFNKQTYFKSNFPSDSAGSLCGIEQPAYPYIYFNNPPAIGRRVCVSKCPSSSDNKLDCTPTNNIGCRFTSEPGFENVYYDNQAEQTRDGKFCFPKDQTLKQQILQNSNLAHREMLMKSTDLIMISVCVAVGLSVFYLLLTQFLPIIMNRVAVILGILITIGILIAIFLYNSQYSRAKWIVFSIVLIVLIITILTLTQNLSGWSVNGIFLRQASNMACSRCYSFGYIVLFITLTIIFIIGMLFEFKFLWGLGKLTFNPDESLFHKVVGGAPSFMTFLWFIQAVWGLSFLKQAFNFCLSDTAVLWYYDKDEGFFHPLHLILCKHLGSIIAGSFMTGFFSILDYIFDFLKPNVEENPDGCYTNCYGTACGLCNSIFDLVRSDSMAYISLTGNPYCNSSRYCEYLCDRSLLMDNSQSVGRAYRIFSHLLLATSVALISMYIKGPTSLLVIGFIMVLSIFISTFFISFHSDAGEALMMIFLEDEQFGRRQMMKQNNKFDERNLGTAFNNKKKTELSEELKKMRIEQFKIEEEAKRKSMSENQSQISRPIQPNQSQLR